MPVVTNTEIQKLEEIMPTEFQTLDDIHSRTTGIQQTCDVDSLLHLHQTSSRRDKQLHWHLIITASICVIILGIIIFYYHSFRHSKCYAIFKQNTTVQNPTTSNPDPQQELQNTTRYNARTGDRSIRTQRSLIFFNATYRLV